MSSISSVSKRLISLQGYLQEFREETVCLHKEYRNFFTEKSDSILTTLNHLKNLSPRSTIPEFRTDRLGILDLEKFYLRDSHRIYSEVRFLFSFHYYFPNFRIFLFWSFFVIVLWLNFMYHYDFQKFQNLKIPLVSLDNQQISLNNYWLRIPPVSSGLLAFFWLFIDYFRYTSTIN